MALDGKILAKAREQLDIVKQNNAAEHDRRVAGVYARVPEIARIDMRLREQMVELVGLTIKKGDNMAAAIEALEKENLELQAKKAELLVENGYSSDWLDDIYSCPKCKDTGFYDGEVCGCLMELYNKELTSELGVLLQSGDESFEKFSLGYYDDVRNPVSGISDRDQMALVFETCREYANSFSPRSLNLLFQGGTGLGKTFLSACIARTVADKGFSVCYDTASAALDAFEAKKFARDAETAENAAVKVERMLSCDLMILDDLGTEMPTPMAISALYTLINTRLINGKKTVISTNCTDDELSKRYSQQIFSRLEGEFFKLSFVGRDIRAIKKEM